MPGSFSMTKAPTSSIRPLRSSARTALGAALLLAVSVTATSLAPTRADARAPRAPAPVAATEATAQSRLRAALSVPVHAELRRFYGARAWAPLWTAGGAVSPAGETVAGLIASADLDGIDPAEVYAGELRAALRRLRGEPGDAALTGAELALSRSLAAYVRLTREAPRGAMLYEHVSLEPQVPDPARALWEAAQAPALDRYVADMAWLHPLYGQLRRAYVASGRDDAAMRQTVTANLMRLRALPAVPPGGRYILVNAAVARLWMYEGEQPVGSMKVVVGKVDHQTPVMSGYVRYAILNPYWNVPADFTRDKIAPKVLRQGQGYLRRAGLEVLSGWDDDAAPVDPASVDWRAVASGAIDLRVRQAPGPANSMGKVKFEFPNQLGIYLHDTPQTELMREEARQFSSGCVRLEDAQRLGAWLFRGTMPGASQSEQRFDLPALVPVYITYLTAQPQPGGGLALLADPYGRDRGAGPALALYNGAPAALR